VRESHFMDTPCVYIEIRQSSLKALKGETGLELPLERAPGGGLTKACREKLTISLQGFLKKEVWQPRFRAYCAIGARGVSLRRLTLPATTKENFKRLLTLQIESEFPLPPDALAWGYRQISGAGAPADPASISSAAKQQLLVVAVKREVVEEYSEILSECGVVPVFTVAALARRHARQHPPQTCALLDVGRNYTELTTFEDGEPLAIRVLPWGGESMTSAIADKLGISRDEAEKLKIELAQAPSGGAERGPIIQAAIDAALDSLAGAINGHWTGQKIYLSGRSAQVKDLAPQLARRLGNGTQCELLDLTPGEGRSAAVLGLRTATAHGKESPLVTLQSKPTNGSAALSRPASWKWAALALGLAIFSMALPYLQAPWLNWRLSKRLKAIQADRGRLVAIDRELDFLRHIKQNQPPYLDALFLLAKAVPPGSKLDSVSMNRRGDLALRGSMKDGTQVAGFRSKLIDSGFFSSVAVEEQTPTPDRQKVTVRITAQWKPANDRQSLLIGPTAEELEKAKNRPKDPPPGAFPPMNMGPPGGMPMMPSMPGGGPMPGRGKRMSAPGSPMMPSPPPAANP
jgi:Tfp pilus assembly PilM family ATPase